MNAAKRVGLLVLGVGAAGLGACEKSTNRYLGSPSSEPNRDANRGTYSFAYGEGAGTAAKPAIGGGPRSTPEIRQTTGAEAMWAIAGARCDHEIVCQRVGPSAKYKTREQCVAALEKGKETDSIAQSCPDGVSELGLTGCLRAIREEACDGQSTARINACLAERFCTPPTMGSPAAGSAPGGG